MLHARAARPLRTSLFATIAMLIVALMPSPSARAMVSTDDPTTNSTASAGGYRWRFKGSERCLMRKVNKSRRRHGMRALDWDKQIGYVARRHAMSMAQQRSVYHDYSLGQKVTRWRRLGQNTGRGGKCSRIYRSFLHSTAHRANIFGRWRHLGIGTTWAGGRLYVQQVFESRRDPGNVYSYP